jgi:hypothetical protein
MTAQVSPRTDDKGIPLSFCSVCSKRIKFAHKHSPYHGLACGRECWRRIEYRYAVMLTYPRSTYSKEREDELATAERDT